jgi:hypothetical protein
MEGLLDLSKLLDVADHCGAHEFCNGSVLRMEPTKFVEKVSIETN